MTCRLLSLSSEAMWPELLRLLENRDNPDQTVETDVRAMLDAVRKGGDSAVLEYVRRFDCPDMRPPLRVPAEDLEQAARDIPAESLDCIKQAADNIRAFHEAQKDRSWFLTRDDGTILGQKIEDVSFAVAVVRSHVAGTAAASGKPRQPRSDRGNGCACHAGRGP